MQNIFQIMKENPKKSQNFSWYFFFSRQNLNPEQKIFLIFFSQTKILTFFSRKKRNLSSPISFWKILRRQDLSSHSQQPRLTSNNSEKFIFREENFWYKPDSWTMSFFFLNHFFENQFFSVGNSFIFDQKNSSEIENHKFLFAKESSVRFLIRNSPKKKSLKKNFNHCHNCSF